MVITKQAWGSACCLDRVISHEIVHISSEDILLDIGAVRVDEIDEIVGRERRGQAGENVSGTAHFHRSCQAANVVKAVAGFGGDSEQIHALQAKGECCESR